MGEGEQHGAGARSRDAVLGAQHQGERGDQRDGDDLMAVERGAVVKGGAAEHPAQAHEIHPRVEDARASQQRSQRKEAEEPQGDHQPPAHQQDQRLDALCGLEMLGDEIHPCRQEARAGRLVRIETPVVAGGVQDATEAGVARVYGEAVLLHHGYREVHPGALVRNAHRGIHGGVAEREQTQKPERQRAWPASKARPHRPQISPLRAAILSFHTMTTASAKIRRLILLSPARRSTNTMGTSSTCMPLRSARKVVSI